MFPPCLLAKLVEVKYKSGYLPRGKPQHYVVVEESVDPFKWAPTPISNMNKDFHVLYML
jgi:hypothetical protein